MRTPLPDPTASVRSRRRRTSVVALVVLATVAPACGSDDEATAPTVARTTSDPSSDPIVHIELRDFEFDGVPASIAAGTRIAVTNRSVTEAHELTAFRLPDGEHRPLSELSVLPMDELGAFLSAMPALAMVARPGEDGEVALGDGSLHDPGRYLLVCFIPLGADPDDVMSAMAAAAADPEAGPPQIEGGQPHMSAGMMAELVVTP